MTLSTESSSRALEAQIGRRLEMETWEAAWGLAEVVDENMANAARVHAVENGEDLSEYTMIAFGGAAPLHAGRLCEKLGISRCLVPQGAGVGSAIGFLRAPFSFEANRSVFMKVSRFDSVAVRRLFSEMEEEATRVVRSCGWEEEILTEYKVYMRYSGQGWEIPVPISPEQAQVADPAIFLERFESDYANLFGRTVHGLEAEITVWSVNAFTPPEPKPAVEPIDVVRTTKPNGDRQLFDAARGKHVRAPIYDRTTLSPGARIQGPAIITEEETTIILPSSRTAVALTDGCVDVHAQNTNMDRQESVDA